MSTPKEPRVGRLNRMALARIRRQATRWIADLHDPEIDAGREARMRRWLAADPRHAAAFREATHAYRRSGPVPFAEVSFTTRRRFGKRLALAATGCALLVVCGVALKWRRENTVETGAREQRIVALGHGTAVTLNANSLIRVDYDAKVRRVSLVRGEAWFEVSKHEARPFEVMVGDRKVVATGTSFVVRVDDPAGARFDVTLVEGHVTIEPAAWPDAWAIVGAAAPGVDGRVVSRAESRRAASRDDRHDSLRALSPGQRLRFSGEGRSGDAPPTADAIDAPSIERVTAWRHGQLVFDDVSLGEAVEEFNRYDPGCLEVDDRAARTIRVGGVFRIGDSASFAAAMSAAHRLRIIERGHTRTLTPSD